MSVLHQHAHSMQGVSNGLVTVWAMVAAPAVCASARLKDLVRQGSGLRIWALSPLLCMHPGNYILTCEAGANAAF